MSIAEALVGAKLELASLPSHGARFSRLLELAKLFVVEIAGSMLMIPYGARALRTYYSLPHATAMLEAWMHGRRSPSRVALVRGVRYGPAERNLVDIYLPVHCLTKLEHHEHEDLLTWLRDPYPVALANDSSPRAPFPSPSPSATPPSLPAPLAVFVHGGVWATGERWHYSPLATRLAEAGVIAIVASYSLYPARIHQMVQEIDQLLTWSMTHASRLGSEERNVTLLGHSAGAQLCAMALLHRATRAASTSTSTATRRSSTKKGGGKRQQEQQQDGSHSIANAPPRRFIGMSGVYDIQRHYEYEAARGVAELSTMKRAMGGHEAFAQWSPSLLIAHAAENARQGRSQDDSTRPLTPPSSSSSSSSPWRLHGQVLSSYAGYHPTPLSTHPPLDPKHAIPLNAMSHLPPVTLMHSCSDLTVPWYESSDMHTSLTAAGADCELLLYNKLDHAALVTGWTRRGKESSGVVTPQSAIRNGGHAEDALPSYAQDVLSIINMPLV